MKSTFVYTTEALQDLMASTEILDELREIGSDNFDHVQRHDFRTFSHLHELSWFRLQCETTGYLFH